MSEKSKPSKYDFAKPEKIVEVCELMQRIESWRAQDRAKINNLFNGGRPYTAEEEQKFQIQINVNWGEGKRIMSDANLQLNSALLHPGQLFSCTTDSGPVDKRQDWGINLSKNLHIPIQRGRSGKRHFFLIRSRNATVSMHGIGPLMWTSDYKWMPRFVPLEDLLLPTDTYCDLSNMRYFAVNLYLTPGEFVRMTQGENTDRGWNQEYIREILDNNRKIVSENGTSFWRDQPEAMMQVFKQNQGWYFSDAIPTIKLRAFYYQEIEEPQRWYRHIILREDVGNAKPNQFVYNGSDKVFADHIDNILNIQYGDGNLVAPLKYHATRGLGVDLYAPVETSNRLRCEFVQSVFEHLKMYFKIQDPADKDRLKQVVLQQFGFIPEGLQIVPRDQRHQIDPAMVQQAMASVRQMMAENSSAYTSSPDNGTNKERTKFEVSVDVNQANKMISGMLGSLYVQESFYYTEILRRFCKKNSTDPEVVAFRQRCLKDNIPEEMLQSERWNISPERVLGGGDRSIAMMQSQWLLENQMRFGPESQQKILRIATTTVLDDPAKGRNLVPEAPPQSTSGSIAAEQSFGTLMTGNNCPIRNGIDYQGYIGRMLQMMAAVVEQVQAVDNMGTPQQVIGLSTCSQNVTMYLQVMAGDDLQKQQVRQFADILGQIDNEVKGFAARQQEASQEGAQDDPETQAKVQGMVLQAQTKAQISEANAAQKMQQKEAQFAQKMEQQAQQHAVQMEKMIADATVQIETVKAKTLADIKAMQAKSENQPKKVEKKS